jgi:hypothetical protein
MPTPTFHPLRALSGLAAGPALACVLALGVSACGDDPFDFDWDDTPETVLLYSLARPELNLESGYAFRLHQRVRVEAAAATGNWDAALDTRAGALVWLPPGALGVAGSAARITTLPGVTLEDVIVAPSDTTLYTANEAVPIELGTVYIIKTSRTQGAFGSSCVYYAKAEAQVLDPIGGALTFRYVTSPICNSLELIPPD